ncbi:MAG: DUF192 domain-containing protein [Candidatus Yonathbacteria bacterium]|nr:DUF192 domain-containing protein [Candidatus Yonathbacteria bacterium]
MKQTTLIGRILLGALYISITVAILAAVMRAPSPKNPYQSKVFLAGVEIMVAIADTPHQREKGLSGYKALEPNEGMLFIFPEPGFHGFWMRDMLFPIDIIWFDENRRIVDAWENASPASFPQIYTPRAPSQFVLEVPAGFFVNHALNVGDTIEILR